jgi:hypothetical protein
MVECHLWQAYMYQQPFAVHWLLLLLQVVATWLKQYLPFKLLSDSSVALLAEVGWGFGGWVGDAGVAMPGSSNSSSTA